ncbi:Piso0_005205 [Millerozyma farinosa CBS 7064]|uniref:Piso0_005205 protein n=1 Tax=Pichia sorbitophila (strain ATCC MYA-4447 / BCRC 22081 / CBS 7064 / NBRC 10061 / NRRL Y-12695) TaxID=559304 RepID=G8Y1J7_PICSO|nr:Piso0_005205 [Millerozyma farinosa CBS 7064]
MADSKQQKETTPGSGNPNGVNQNAEGQNAPINPANAAQYAGQEGYYLNANYTYNNKGNKHYKHYNRHSYNNSNSGNSNGTGHNLNNNNNRQHYNRKNYNHKINHNNQYGSYGGYPANIYAYGYYPSPYGYTTAPMVPGLPPMQSFQQPPYSPIPAGKVKITDKEGKQIDFEEKRKLTNSTNSPVSSPSLSKASPSISSASPSPAQAPLTEQKAVGESAASPSSSPVPAPASTTNKLSVAEEFKRKVLEKAAKATAAQKKGDSKPDEQQKQESEPAAAPAKEASASEQHEQPSTGKESKDTESQSTGKAAEESTTSTVESETVSKEKTPTAEPKESSEGKEEKDDSQKTATPSSDATAREESADAEAGPEGDDEENEKKLDDVSNIKSESATGDEENKTPEDQADVDSENKDDTEAEAKEDGLTLTQYFEKLASAEEIQDPFSFTYPENITGVDSKWKSDAKKFRYDPQFLIQFRDAVSLTVDDEWKNKLDGLGIVATNNKRGQAPHARGMGKFGLPVSNRFGGSLGGKGQFGDGRANSRSGSKRRGGSTGPREKSSRKGNQSKRGRDSRENRDREDDKPAEEVKPLEKSANRWVPRSRVKKTEVKYAPDGSVILDDEDVERKIKSLLNKLTLEMFEPITDDILKIAEQSKWEEDAKTARKVISLTFAKACDEPYWSSMYAQFCAKMCTKMPEEITDVNIRLKNGELAKGGDLARRLLLTTCQAEYEKGWSDKLPTKEDGTPLEPEMMSDEYYQMAAAKRRGLGLVKFIGHLYILNMLNDQVILLCLRDQSNNTKDPSEDSLENLAQLVTTVGARLETTEKNRAVLNFVFDNIQTILDNCKLSSRIKFMLMDLQDLRAAKWKSIKEEAGPKTIQEIHNEAELKKLEEEKAAAERRRKNKNSEPRSGSSRAGSSWGNQGKRNDQRMPSKENPRGFTSVQSSRSQSNRPNVSSESNSSYLSPRENSKRTESIQSQANMFAALGEGGDEDDNNDDEHENANDVGNEHTESSKEEPSAN